MCFVVGTPRLLQAAERVASGGRFPELEVRALDVAAQPWRELVDAGQRLRGNVPDVERLLVRAVTNRDDFAADVTLDWVDVRDLVAVARTTVDARLFGEIERRVARRGKYQRGRAANVLGWAREMAFADGGKAFPLARAAAF